MPDLQLARKLAFPCTPQRACPQELPGGAKANRARIALDAPSPSDHTDLDHPIQEREGCFHLCHAGTHILFYHHMRTPSDHFWSAASRPQLGEVYETLGRRRTTVRTTPEHPDPNRSLDMIRSLAEQNDPYILSRIDTRVPFPGLCRAPLHFHPAFGRKKSLTRENPPRLKPYYG